MGGVPPGSRLPHEMQARVRAALRMGLSISATARRLDVSRDEVRTIAERAGLVERRPSWGGPGNKRGQCPDCHQLTGALPHRCPLDILCPHCGKRVKPNG